MKKYTFWAIPCFLYLLFFPVQTAEAARAGLLLWYHSVLPVLFPFMFLCSLILSLDLLETLPSAIYRPVIRLFGCSFESIFVILAGFLCGFPMGAKLASDLKKQKKINSSEARFLYGFVNNPSPAFLMSYVASEQMQDTAFGFLLLLPVLGSAFLYGMLSSVPYREKNKKTAGALHPAQNYSIFPIIDDCLNSSINNTVKLGGYIILSCILCSALSRILPKTNPGSMIFLSCIELTNGVQLIASSALSLSIKYIILSGLCAFGGFSVLLQTIGIAHMDKSTVFYYIKSRVIITLLSILIAVCLVLFSFFL